MSTDLDTVLDRVQDILDQLGDIVAEIRTDLPDPKATVDTMTVGGWVQLPGRQRWRKILNITKCLTSWDENCYRVDFPAGDPDGSFVHLSKWDAYPFLTQEQFDRACDTEGATA